MCYTVKNVLKSLKDTHRRPAVGRLRYQVYKPCFGQAGVQLRLSGLPRESLVV